MTSTDRSKNHEGVLWAVSSITGQAEYVNSTNHILNSTATISGSSIPISGATTGIGVAILDGSGNQITSFGGGTQYTQGGATVANPTGTAEIWFDGSGNPKAVTPSQPLPSNLTDGTTVTSIVAGDTGFNGVVTNKGVKTLTFTTSSSGAQTILANTDVRGYAWIYVIYSSVGSGLANTGQFSTTSGGTYLNSATFANATNTSSPGQLGVASGQIYNSPVTGNYFQINVSALTSGTFSGTVILSTASIPFPTTFSSQSGTWTVGANSATGSAVPANAFYIGINDISTGNLVAARAAGSTINTASGILGAASMAVFDDVAPTSITENNFGAVRMSANRNLYGTIRDAAGNERGVNVNASNQMSVSVDNQTPGTGATNLGKAEDAAHTTGDTGVAVWAVRNDGNATSFTNTTGDYNPISTLSDGSVHVVQQAQTSTGSNVAGSATSVTLLSANNSRKGGSIYNDSSAILYVKFGTTASTTDFKVALAAGSYYEIPAGYVGRIDGIWASATGSARVAEET